MFSPTRRSLTLAPPSPLREEGSQLRRRERVAGRYLALFQPFGEPALALLRSAVGKGVRHHIATRLLLQAVVADGRGGLQRRLHVARLNALPLLIGMKRPDAGEAVGLQFDAHLDAVRSRFAARGLLRILRLWQNAEQVLHVMTDLMRDDVSLREFAGLAGATAEAHLDVAEERGVEIDTLVARAVERSHRRLRK